MQWMSFVLKMIYCNEIDAKCGSTHHAREQEGGQNHLSYPTSTLRDVHIK